MNESLLTDFYQLTMAEIYIKKGLLKKASFEFFIRRRPERRNFFIAAGLEKIIEYLKELKFQQDEIDFLRERGFSKELIDYLKKFRFQGDVWALPEGTIFFENEPVIRVEAPLPQAQIVETRIINILHFQILIASKAVRCVLSAPNKALIDFGLRRAHGFEAGLYAARSCYLAGFIATSTVEAGRLFKIPITGTMAHSFILAHESEEAAFRNFIETHPENPILLIDTFDTIKAAYLAAKLYREYLKNGIKIKGVRIDSGNYIELSKKVRKIFDSQGAKEMMIFCSGGLDEYKLKELTKNDVPIDGFGLGTLIDTSSDVPFLDCAYKMVEYDGTPKMKFSKGKATLPFKKQIMRYLNKEGLFSHDIICTSKEAENSNNQGLLVEVMRGGKLIAKGEGISVIRDRVKEQLSSLPHELKSITNSCAYDVKFSSKLKGAINSEVKA